MKRIAFPGLAMLAFGLAACGGGDADPADDSAATTTTPAPAPAPAPASTTVNNNWLSVDETARTVTIDLVAGQTDQNNHWNYNGHANGSATVVVPVGYNVQINFSNQDPINVHSAAILGDGDFSPDRASQMVSFDDVSPAFAGAITANATSMTDATAPAGGSESIQFTASEAGEYYIVCLVPAHASTGMWIGFTVSADGSSGIRM